MKTRFVSLALFCLVLFLTVPAAAKDTWISVRSKNFFLIGNAGEKEIRQVATKLEQFRETFRLVFSRAKFTNSIQTNVVVFKSSAAYKPFKPKRDDQKADEMVAGYFKAGEDVNYITLSTEGEKEDTYSIIFHEYVHFLLNTNFGATEIPPWFNEGLAEYYETFRIANDQKVSLGLFKPGHLYLLRQTPLIPLKTFFQIDNYSLHRNGNHSRSIFYAQAWALMHYLIQGTQGAGNEALSKFLLLVMSKTDPEQAFKQSFGYDYATMEKALKNYIEQHNFRSTLITFNQKLVFDAEMTSAPLSEAAANGYLGDLLYHTHELDSAETYLQKALALDENMSLANTAMGLVRMRQKKFDEAKKYLEKAIGSGQRNHFAYYNHAYVLSREDMDEFGYVYGYPPEKAKKIRESLQKAIEINPEFTESYRLLAFVSMVNHENLDEAVNYLKKALSLRPGSQEYALMIAQIYLRQEKLREARELAERLSKTAGDEEVRSGAESILKNVKDREELLASMEKSGTGTETGGAPVIRQRKSMSPEEIARIQAEAVIDGVNKMLQKPKEGEKQVVGFLQKVACAGGEVNYTVKTESEVFQLLSKDFASLNLLSLTPESENLSFGCSAQLQNILAVMIYRPGKDAKVRGTLTALAFVPKNFRLKTAEELAKSHEVTIVDEAESGGTPAGGTQQRREAMMQGILNALRKPRPDEKRVIGILEKIECSGSNVFFYVKSGADSLKLRADSPRDINIVSFIPGAARMQFGCGARISPLTAVITFLPADDPKANDAGEIFSVEFVPDFFKLP